MTKTAALLPLMILAIGLGLPGRADADHGTWLPDAGPVTFTVWASPALPGLPAGAEETVAVDGRAGRWRHYTDFLGLGPRWVHAGLGNRIYLWSGGRAVLLADLDAREGASWDLALDGARVRSSLHARSAEVTTLAGTWRGCRLLGLSIVGGPDRSYRSVLAWLARGAGVVRFTEQATTEPSPYVAAVHHDRGRTRVSIPEARDAAAAGDLVCVAAGARGLVLVSGGRVVDTLRLRGEALRVSAAGRRAYVTTLLSTAASAELQLHVVDLDARRVTRTLPSLSNPVVVPVGDRLIAVLGRQVELLDPATGALVRRTPEVHGISGHGFDVGFDVSGGRVYAPRAYPGGLAIVDPTTAALDVIETFDWLHDVQVVGRSAFVAGDFDGLHVIDLDTRTLTSLAARTHPDAHRVWRLRLEGGSLYAVTEASILELDAAGDLVGRTPLPADVAGERASIVGVRDGAATLLVAGEGLVMVRLATP